MNLWARLFRLWHLIFITDKLKAGLNHNNCIGIIAKCLVIALIKNKPDSYLMKLIIFLLLACTTITVNGQVSFDTSSLIRDNKAIYSLVVSVKDSVLYVRSFNGKKNDDLFNNQSL